jgi:hypothetical protein
LNQETGSWLPLEGMMRTSAGPKQPKLPQRHLEVFGSD